MGTLLLVLVVVIVGTGGELAVSYAMKRTGEVQSFAPRALLTMLRQVFRERAMWLGILLMTVSFFSFLALLSWENVSLVVPATALNFVVGAVGARFLLREEVDLRRWAGAVLVCLGVALVWTG
jgi:drug/metabolite transporter (DMT)-like permease